MPRTSRYNVVVEYRRAGMYEGDPTLPWRNLYEYNSDNWESDEARDRDLQRHLTDYAFSNRDYQVRCIDYATGHVFFFLPAGVGAARFPDNEEVVWNVPNAHNRPLTGDFRHMIKVGIRRIGGKLTLLVNAKEFHDQLDEMGCTFTGNRYNDRPAAANTIASSGHVMSTEMLLLRDYKEIDVVERRKTDTGFENVTVKVPVTATADLGTVWSNPPSFDNLKKLCNSANDAARKILEHYQPIDIEIEIHKKVVKNA